MTAAPHAHPYLFVGCCRMCLNAIDSDDLVEPAVCPDCLHLADRYRALLAAHHDLVVDSIVLDALRSP